MKAVVSILAISAVMAVSGIAVWPDFTDAILPPNIAPFNFRVIGKGRPTVTLKDPGGGELRAKVDSTGVAEWREGEWRESLSRNAGGAIFFELACGEERTTLTNRVAREAIDTHLVYRLIPPGYSGFSEMGIYRRDLGSFAEEVIVQNAGSDYHRCLNCHIPNWSDPGEYVRHFRKIDAGTEIVSRRHGRRFTSIGGTPGTAGGAAYPAWHPSGDYIAFSVNETRQFFRMTGLDLIEVVDLSSDMMVYSLADRVTIPVETGREFLESCPAWSADGKVLYSVRAADPIAGVGEKDRLNAMSRKIGAVRYDLVARDFDLVKRAFSAPRTLFSGVNAGKSASWPRPSPDGRWVVFTAADHGYFHIWHGDADLYVLDLKTGQVRVLDEINSKFAESYHSFSRNGRWLVFSSRRDDGSYTRPYFAHFDPVTGHFGKPFPLPLSYPDHYFRQMRSYNVPEFENHGL